MISRSCERRDEKYSMRAEERSARYSKREHPVSHLQPNITRPGRYGSDHLAEGMHTDDIGFEKYVAFAICRMAYNRLTSRSMLLLRTRTRCGVEYLVPDAST